jgi:hypothetical protein
MYVSGEWLYSRKFGVALTATIDSRSPGVVVYSGWESTRYLGSLGLKIST